MDLKNGRATSNLECQVKQEEYVHAKVLENPILVKAVNVSTTCTQLLFRYNQLHFCWQTLHGSRESRLLAKNIIYAIGFDISLGLCFSVIFLFFSITWLNCGLHYADIVVSSVESLLHYLISMPVGLKLNRPLNHALGHFFEYHIHVWKTYITIVKPIFDVTKDLLLVSSIFGFTSVLGLTSDLLSVITIHIYCFYGYAARLYGFQAACLWSLWRLFRGKKWNKLKNRVDSYSYGNDQLFIGTILFTILLFLLPTVLLYYLVFLVLRLGVLFIQMIIRYLLCKLSSVPVYSVFLWLINAEEMRKQIYFKLVPSATNLLEARLELKRIGLGQLIRTSRSPVSSPFLSETLPPMGIIKAILWGQIIYPL